jgi:predicted dehydrogenase
MKIALVGLGYWGSKLLRNVVALVGVDNVVAVDSHLDRADQACSTYPGLAVRAHLEEALEIEDLRCVIIATPAESHAALARLALDAGRHVMVEKPLASSVEDAEDIVRMAEQRQLALMVGHTFLFSPRVQWMTDYVATGRMGDVHYLTSSRLNLGLHRQDANVIWDLAPHDFSIAFTVLGELPVSVQASARGLIHADIPDVAFITMEFPSGTIASIDVSWMAPKKIRNTTVVGDTSMIIYDDIDAEEPIKVYDKGVVFPESADFGQHQLTYRYGNTVAPHIQTTEPLSNELSHFLDAASNDRPRTMSDGRFGLAVVRALAAADESWQSNGRPVAIDNETATV